MMGYPYGSTAASSSSGGWPTAAVVAVAVRGAILIGRAAAFVVPRVRKRSHPGRGRDQLTT